LVTPLVALRVVGVPPDNMPPDVVIVGVHSGHVYQCAPRRAGFEGGDVARARVGCPPLSNGPAR
jgi:hypothetical protein